MEFFAGVGDPSHCRGVLVDPGPLETEPVQKKSRSGKSGKSKRSGKTNWPSEKDDRKDVAHERCRSPGKDMATQTPIWIRRVCERYGKEDRFSNRRTRCCLSNVVIACLQDLVAFADEEVCFCLSSEISAYTCFTISPNSGDQHGYLLPDTFLDDGKLLKYITQNHSQVRVVLVSSRAKPLSGRPRSAG